MRVGTLNRRERRMGEEVAVHTEDPKALRRAQALLWRERGESTRAVAERWGVSRRTVFNWGGALSRAPRAGDPEPARGWPP